MRSYWNGGGLRSRICGRCRTCAPVSVFAAVIDKLTHLNIVRPRIRLRIKGIRDYGPHPHLFRSARTLRVRYFHFFLGLH